MAKAIIAQERLRKLLDYDAETGILTWRVNRPPRGKAGAVAGHERPDGYRTVSVDGVIYLAYRLIWCWYYGQAPKHCIDHIDGNPRNNRIENLRDVPHRVNMQNKRKATSRSKLKTLGVRQHTKTGFQAVIGTGNGTMKCLGSFKTIEEAHQAYLIAKRELHEGCTL